jgi:hypothetical protein
MVEVELAGGVQPVEVAVGLGEVAAEGGGRLSEVDRHDAARGIVGVAKRDAPGPQVFHHREITNGQGRRAGELHAREVIELLGALSRASPASWCESATDCAGDGFCAADAVRRGYNLMYNVLFSSAGAPWPQELFRELRTSRAG